MEWLEISVQTVPDCIERLTQTIEDEGITGLVIDDEQDFESFLENNRQYWDYVDEDLRREKEGVCAVKFYVADDDEGREQLARVRAAVDRLREQLPAQETGTLEMTEKTVRDEDWENEYKKYYKPIPVGKKILILPSWEEEPEGNGRLVLRLDPGISFGSGGHATTRLCLELMEDVVKKGGSVLDLGSGSGILSIGAMLLGAGKTIGCDIDSLAADISGENAEQNGFSTPECRYICGNVLTDEGLKEEFAREKFDLVLANIVADVIIPLSGFVRRFMAEDGYLICSGIIGPRSDEVEAVLRSNGFTVLRRCTEDDWTAFLLK